jgi:hypothetical protein
METFVVRIWSPADAGERDKNVAVKGRLEHVTSGRRVVFRGVEELGTLIVRELRRTGKDAGATGEGEG